MVPAILGNNKRKTALVKVRQPEQLGLGLAVMCAELAVGNDPFSVLLADDFLTYCGAGITSDLAEAYGNLGKI